MTDKNDLCVCHIHKLMHLSDERNIFKGKTYLTLFDTYPNPTNTSTEHGRVAPIQQWGATGEKLYNF